MDLTSYYANTSSAMAQLIGTQHMEIHRLQQVINELKNSNFKFCHERDQFENELRDKVKELDKLKATNLENMDDMVVLQVKNGDLHEIIDDMKRQSFLEGIEEKSQINCKIINQVIDDLINLKKTINKK